MENISLQNAILNMLKIFFVSEGNGMYMNYISIIATLAIVAGLVILLLSAFGGDRRTAKNILLIMVVGVSLLFVGNFIFESVFNQHWGYKECGF